MHYYKLVILVFLSGSFFKPSKAQIQRAFERNDVEKLENILISDIEKNGYARYDGNDESKVIKVFLREYIRKQKIGKRYILVNPYLLSITFDRLTLDSVGGEYLFTFDYDSDLKVVKKTGFYIQDGLNILPVNGCVNKDILFFLHQKGTASVEALTLYKQKVDFLQQKILLDNTYNILGTDKDGKVVYQYDLTCNINVELISFNRLKDRATVFYRNKNSMCLAYLKRINSVWKLINTNYIVMY